MLPPAIYKYAEQNIHVQALQSVVLGARLATLQCINPMCTCDCDISDAAQVVKAT
jgi:hypothetical protein